MTPRFARLLSLGLCLGGCASAPTAGPLRPTAFEPTDAAFDRAFVAYAEANRLRPLGAPTQVIPVSMGGEPPLPGEPVSAGIVVEGLLAGETLSMVKPTPGAAPELAFETASSGGSCGESPPGTTYRFAQAGDGTIVIARLVPTIHEVIQHQAGSCEVGCGPVPPPSPVVRYFLPETSRVRVLVVPWDAELVRITCDDPIPRQ